MTQYEIGDRIRNLRNEAQLTQQQLADLIKVSNKAVSKWENNEGIPDIDNLKRLAHVFDVSMDVLVGHEQEKTIESESLNRDGLIVIGLIGVSLLMIFLPFIKMNPLNTIIQEFAPGNPWLTPEFTNGLAGQLGVNVWMNVSGLQLLMNGFSNINFSISIFMISIIGWIGFNAVTLLYLYQKKKEMMNIGALGAATASFIFAGLSVFLQFTNPQVYKFAFTPLIILLIQVILSILVLKKDGDYYEIK